MTKIDELLDTMEYLRTCIEETLEALGVVNSIRH